MTPFEKQFDVPIPLQDDEQHTGVHVTGEEAEVDRVVGAAGGTGGTPGAGGGHPGTT